MYTVNVQVEGIAPLMQHRFPMPDFADMGKGSKVVTGKVDYSQEWRQSFYANGHGIYQPSIHFESSMVKAAGSFKIPGKRGASYKDLFKSNVFIYPEEILFNVEVPTQLDNDADKELYLDCRPVVVNKARVVRMRPTFKRGWKLEFEIQVGDDQIPPDVVKSVLDQSGKVCGVGDFRPRFGRFMVTKFEVVK